MKLDTASCWLQSLQWVAFRSRSRFGADIYFGEEKWPTLSKINESLGEQGATWRDSCLLALKGTELTTCSWADWHVNHFIRSGAEVSLCVPCSRWHPLSNGGVALSVSSKWQLWSSGTRVEACGHLVLLDVWWEWTSVTDSDDETDIVSKCWLCSDSANRWWGKWTTLRENSSIHWYLKTKQNMEILVLKAINIEMLLIVIRTQWKVEENVGRFVGDLLQMDALGSSGWGC